MNDRPLIGIGLYTPTEAGRLLGVSGQRISRWLRGYSGGGRTHEPLWRSEVDIGDGHVYLGFRDLMEVRIVNRFIGLGISAQRVRAAIRLASEIVGDAHPLSTRQFQTDGRNIFLRTTEADAEGSERERLLDLFKRQYEFSEIISPLLKGIEFDGRGAPASWWPVGEEQKILIDPARAFGQPIDAESSVPTAILARAGEGQGVENAARSFGVSVGAVTRAMAFEAGLGRRIAA
ncbi:hypothetical protein [Acidiphilium acidophilum]|uniref:hypothetical protein n=1 Tax=Acidiphilium acidophilum TaxID=76588 RepID=UPI002E8E78F0|nr:hypothetical protein [Acidiphilium acidophilum]